MHWICDLYMFVIVNCEFVIWLAGMGVHVSTLCLRVQFRACDRSRARVQVRAQGLHWGAGL